jgi:hypothetical protein
MLQSAGQNIAPPLGLPLGSKKRLNVNSTVGFRLCQTEPIILNLILWQELKLGQVTSYELSNLMLQLSADTACTVYYCKSPELQFLAICQNLHSGVPVF